MIAWVSSVLTARSTPLTISVPSSSATCRFFSSSSAIGQVASAGRRVRRAHATRLHAASGRGIEDARKAAESTWKIEEKLADGHAEGGPQNDGRRQTAQLRNRSRRSSRRGRDQRLD